MPNCNYNDPELQKFQRQFENAVSVEMSILRKERIVPRVMPLGASCAMVATGFFLNILEHVPEQIRPYVLGVAAFMVAASPFVNRQAGSLIVSREEAIKSIDSRIGGPNDNPAHDFNDLPPDFENHGPEEKAFDEVDKKRKWAKWGDKITNNGSRSAFTKYYGEGQEYDRLLVHGSVFTMFLLTASLSDNLSDKFLTAMNWQPPLPPLEYAMAITPPDKIDGVRVLTDRMLRDAVEEGAIIKPHDHSMMAITTYNRGIAITVNGVALEIEPEIQNQDRRVQEYLYEISLTPEITTISFEDVTLNFDITLDRGPQAKILSATPDARSPGSVRLEYVIKDDVGAVETQLKMGSGPDGEVRHPALEMFELPTILVPN